MKSEIPVIFTALILAGMLVGCDGQRGAVRQSDAAGASFAPGVSEEDEGHADAYEQAYETLVAYKIEDYRKKHSGIPTVFGWRGLHGIYEYLWCGD